MNKEMPNDQQPVSPIEQKLLALSEELKLFSDAFASFGKFRIKEEEIDRVKERELRKYWRQFMDGGGF